MPSRTALGTQYVAHAMGVQQLAATIILPSCLWNKNMGNQHQLCPQHAAAKVVSRIALGTQNKANSMGAQQLAKQYYFLVLSWHKM